MDLKQRRDELVKLRDQSVANANFLAGQLALLDELLAATPAVPAVPLVENRDA